MGAGEYDTGDNGVGVVVDNSSDQRKACHTPTVLIPPQQACFLIFHTTATYSKSLTWRASPPGVCVNL